MWGSLWRTVGAVGAVLGSTTFTARADPPTPPNPAPASAAAPAAPASEPPAGFERFFDRGHIPGLDHPVYVTAAEARRGTRLAANHLDAAQIQPPERPHGPHKTPARPAAGSHSQSASHAPGQSFHAVPQPPLRREGFGAGIF